MACQIENQELRAQIGELRKQNSTPVARQLLSFAPNLEAKRQRDQALLSRQHMQSHKVLLKRGSVVCCLFMAFQVIRRHARRSKRTSSCGRRWRR